MGTTWTNGVVSLTHDFIFGVSILSENGWFPVSMLTNDEQAYVRRLVDNNPSCPWLKELG